MFLTFPCVYMDIVSNGRIRPSHVVEAVDNLMYKMKKKGLWESLDFMVKVWMEKNPEATKQFEQDQKNIQATRRKHAAFENKSNRLLASIPEEIHIFLNTFWHSEIESMGRKTFYTKVVQKYPIFKIPEGNV